MNAEKKPIHPALLLLLTVLPGILGAGALALASGYLVLFEQLMEAVQLVVPTFAAGLLIIYFLCFGLATFAVSEWMRSHPKNPAIYFAAGTVALSALLMFYFSAGYFSVLPAILSVAFLLSGLSMSTALTKGASRTVCALYGSVPAIALSAIVILLYAFSKEQSADFLTALIERLREASDLWSVKMTDFVLADEAAAEMMRELFVQNKLIGEGTSAQQFYEMVLKLVQAAAEMAMMLLPGLIVTCWNVSSYFATLSVSAFSSVQDRSRPFVLTAHVYEAVLFCFLQFIPAFFSVFAGGGLTFLTVVLNLSVIYTPLFFAIGVRTVLKLKWSSLKSNLLFLILGIMLLLTKPVSFLSMLGGYYVISDALRRLMEKTFGIGEGKK